MPYLRYAPLAMAITFLCAVGAAQDTAQLDGNGRIVALRCDDSLEEFQSDIVFALPGWTRTVGLHPFYVSQVVHGRSGETKEWAGKITVDQGKTFSFKETVSGTGEWVRIVFSATAEADIDLASVVFFFRIPVALFGGGTGEITSNGVFVSAADIPAEQGLRPHFLFGTADKFVFTANKRAIELTVASDNPRYVIVQDERHWGMQTYAAYTEFSRGPVTKGQTVSFDIKLKLSGQADHSAVRLTVNPSKVRYRFGGMGGNYVFGLESGAWQYTLDNLRLVWARTQLNIWGWEPENDNDSPEVTDWEKLRARDKPGTDLHRDFLMAGELKKRGIPYIASIWYVPEWMLADPGRGKEAFGRRIATNKWDELLESMGTYLVHARTQYGGTEPDLFSFNESREGVRVLMSAEEHRDAMVKITAHFAKLGLKTKMLLGDVATARDTVPFVLPTVSNEAAMACVGGVSMHTWEGASPAQYAEWGDLAARIRKPLLVAEVGSDPHAWHTPDYIRTFSYAMRDLRMYQDLLAHARPYSLLPWELTSDYPVVHTRKMSDGSTKFIPTLRFWHLKHFANLTPKDADNLAAESPTPGVQITAFTAVSESMRSYVIHIANFGGSRSITLAGLPGDVKSLEPVVTTEKEQFAAGTKLKVENGSATFDAKAMSLTTLTGRMKVNQ
ncbi:MAG: hypothetical protein C0404_08175 [Verrucomicrobia bacterium]|nr:hypothetical protein [Verrucomicrobiota bacterium]